MSQTANSVQAPIDETKLNAFVGKMLGDVGAVASAVNVIVGDRLGLYRALLDGGPQTPQQLAERTRSRSTAAAVSWSSPR